MSCVVGALRVLMGGAVQTTAATTATGLKTAKTNTAAKKVRTIRVRNAPAIAERRGLLVWKVFKFGGQLAHPPTVVEAADEARVPLVASDVQELLLSDEGAQPGQVGVRAVAHDPADDAGQLTPLAFRKRLSVARDRDQQSRGGAGDGVGEDLFGLGPGDDLAPGADDVRNAVPAHSDDVAARSYGRALEVSRPCFHCQAHYSR